ncbi:hypothetical protein MM300_22345 [Evansella sp. LMS18]|uniref:hypothetical protein n=1 Tax=Evansella sp. LMS18 TaxID=2924033 RepID=UPI0020D08688|nr:hypothetical protein [Evansella sp. LMS18]UTR10570.1 hypothetical protein MM300_22345 [Evansella sp. LMS18]
MLKPIIRNLVYQNKTLTKLWINFIKFRDRNKLIHRRIYNKFYFLYLTNLKGYQEMHFDKKITNAMFKIFITLDEKKVYKVIRKDNIYSYNFYRKIKQKDNFIAYSKKLESMNKLEYLGGNISAVSAIHRNGNYEAPYINNDNLQIVKLKLLADEYILDSIEISAILYAIEEIVTNLERYYKKFNYIPGDWMLHNMVYDIKSRKIINIDLEGFYTYRNHEIGNNLERIKNDFEELFYLLRNIEETHSKCRTSITF